MNHDLKIIEKDIEELYLGNLKTVEFDLNLPRTGANGSAIKWISEHDRFLTSDGRVTRPKLGVGDRKVPLHAVFQYGNETKEKIYEVTILEETNVTEVTEIFPLVRRCAPGQEIRLPQSVVVKTAKCEILSYPVEWDGGIARRYPKAGDYKIEGKVEGTAKKAVIIISAQTGYEIPRKDTKSKVWCFTSGEVELLPGTVFWNARERDMAYLKSVDADQILYNFRRAANLDTKGAKPMTGWDSPEGNLRGHTSGHYLSAMALCFRESKDEDILDKINYLVEGLVECQKAFENRENFKEGYIGAYSEEQFDLLEQGVKYPQIWAPYYTLHKILSGLLDCYTYAGNREALQIALKSGKWVYNRLSRLTPELRASMWNTYIAGEFGGINETMAKLYELSGEEIYLACAKMFDNDKLFLPMEEEKNALKRLHANQHIPQIIGSMAIFKATGEKRYYDIARFFWKAVTESYIYVNGGIGESEMFAAPDCIGERITKDTAETCAAYNMLKLTKELYRYEPKASYMDYYERAVWNHMAGTFDHEMTGESTYFYPMNPGAHREFLFENSCCHGTGMESQMKYTEGIYFQDADSIYVNLFISSKLTCGEKGITITQQMSEADPEKVTFIVKGNGEKFHIKIRRPYWCEGEETILINGEQHCASAEEDADTVPAVDENGYFNLLRAWKEDVIEIHFPCVMRIEKTKDRPDIGACAYGPYVFAAIEDEGGADSEGYLSFDESESEKKEIYTETDYRCKTEQPVNYLKFRKSGMTLIPLCHIRNERYHVYHKLLHLN